VSARLAQALVKERQLLQQVHMSKRLCLLFKR
jgi:hypothetical protein